MNLPPHPRKQIMQSIPNANNHLSENEPSIKKRTQLLLIDDDEDFGALMLSIAEAYNIRVKFVTSLSHVNAVELPDYDAIIVDYYLESTTGTELAAMLQETIPHVPLMLISGKSAVDLNAETYPANIKKFVPKTVEGAKLLLSAYKVGYINRP